MFGFRYLKSTPTQYVIHHKNGKVRRSGAGLSFFYFHPSASIALVPVASADVPFIFNETSADFQPLTVQGQLTFRIAKPEVVAGLLNYTVRGRANQYLSDDSQKLPLRLVNRVQILTRGAIQALPLRRAIHASDEVSATVFDQLRKDEPLTALGVEALALSIQAIKPSPEMGRALEAEAREALLRQADDATYDRRNSAVEQERRIKENELNTEIAVEAKKRQIREAKVEADLSVEAKEQQVRTAKLSGQIDLESERARLVQAHVANARAEADAQSYAVEASLRPLKGLPADVLQLLALQSGDPRRMVSLAFKELAANAAKIGNLNITPELLDSLLQPKGEGAR
jgi:hypothetical protein